MAMNGCAATMLALSFSGRGTGGEGGFWMPQPVCVPSPAAAGLREGVRVNKPRTCLASESVVCDGIASKGQGQGSGQVGHRVLAAGETEQVSIGQKGPLQENRPSSRTHTMLAARDVGRTRAVAEMGVISSNSHVMSQRESFHRNSPQSKLSKSEPCSVRYLYVTFREGLHPALEIRHPITAGE
ncbi:hypothetical protein F5144DRAFT_380402 [Chaetomium tenue]|uniref:Uncharacterized protein n=1 Tax=Chaetomium tenue TaxID=1854479 RepID=A0ACB7NUW7_9PEZI|nr:hypothetical protein F5144DRAFT_380402 [Chaetomium globosum]